MSGVDVTLSPYNTGVIQVYSSISPQCSDVSMIHKTKGSPPGGCIFPVLLVLGLVIEMLVISYQEEQVLSTMNY